jgi:hypothetical protein
VGQRNLRRALAGLALLATLAGATACTGETEPVADVHAAIVGAGTALDAAGSATVHFDVTLANQSGRDSVTWTGVRRSTFGDGAASDIEFTAFTVTRPASPAPRTVNLREIVIAGVRYHRSDSLITLGPPWVRVPDGDAIRYGSLIADPDLGLLDVRALLATVERVDESLAADAGTGRADTIDGTDVRLIQVSCGLGRDCDAAALPESFRRLFPGDNRLVLGLWLDEQNRPRRLEISADLDTGRVAGDARVRYSWTATMTIGALGAPVTVTAPDPADVSGAFMLSQP